MDNAPCHPEGLSDRFSNVKVVFLPKNTTSKLQPLDAGIIKNFKVKYQKKLWKFVISRIDSNMKITDIIQEVDILKAISWITYAWGEFSGQTVINWFHKCISRKEHPNIQVLDQEEEEFASLVRELSSDVSPSDYINFDMDVATSQSSVDVESINWRQESRQSILIMVSKKDHWSYGNKIGLRSFAESWSFDTFFSATREWRVTSILDDSHRKAAGHTDN